MTCIIFTNCSSDFILYGFVCKDHHKIEYAVGTFVYNCGLDELYIFDFEGNALHENIRNKVLTEKDSLPLWFEYREDIKRTNKTVFVPQLGTISFNGLTISNRFINLNGERKVLPEVLISSRQFLAFLSDDACPVPYTESIYTEMTYDSGIISGTAMYQDALLKQYERAYTGILTKNPVYKEAAFTFDTRTYTVETTVPSIKKDILSSVVYDMDSYKNSPQVTFISLITSLPRRYSGKAWIDGVCYDWKYSTEIPEGMFAAGRKVQNYSPAASKIS